MRWKTSQATAGSFTVKRSPSGRWPPPPFPQRCSDFRKRTREDSNPVRQVRLADGNNALALPVTKLRAAMLLDKKVSAGEIQFVLARKIGQAEYGHRVPQAVVRRALEFVSQPDAISAAHRSDQPGK